MPRLEVAVIDRDGQALVVNAARPATLVAFEDAHPGRTMPQTIREVAWVVHHALGIEQPLDDWLQTLEDVSAVDDDVALAKRIIAGDETARQIVLGELPPEPADRNDTDAQLREQEGDQRPPPGDPALEQIEAIAGGSSSPA